MLYIRDRQKGEIVTTLTLIGLGVLLIGMIAGRSLVQQGTRMLPKAATPSDVPTPTPPSSTQNIFVVCPTGTAGQNGCNFIGGDGIQQAINTVPVSTNIYTIYIKSGVYTRQNYETVTYSNSNSIRKYFIDTKGKSLIITGEPGTIMDGANSTNMGGIRVGPSGQVEISNLIISGFKYDSTDCLYGYISVVCSSGIGIFADGQANVLIRNNLLKSNIEGIHSKYSVTVTLINNTVVNSIYHGIDFLDSSTGRVANNISAYNSDGGIRASAKERFSALEYNLAFGNTKGNWNDTFGTWPPSSNLSLDPQFVNKEGGDYHLSTGSPARNAGDPSIKNPDNSRSDIGAYGGVGACGLDTSLPGCITITNTPTPTPTGVIVNCGSAAITPPAVGYTSVTYNVSGYTSGWLPVDWYSYSAASTDYPNPTKCPLSPDGSANPCSITADQSKGDYLNFRVNMINNNFGDGYRYVCSWNGNWTKFIGNLIADGCDNSPDPVCAPNPQSQCNNNCAQSVAIVTPTVTPTPTVTCESLGGVCYLNYNTCQMEGGTVNGKLNCTGYDKFCCVFPTSIPTPTVTATPVPGAPHLKLKVRLPDIAATVTSISAAKTEVYIYDDAGVQPLIYTTKIALSRVAGTQYFVSDYFTANVGITKIYKIGVKNEVSLRRFYTGVTLTMNQQLDCTGDSVVAACGQLITERDNKPLLSGDSDGFDTISGSYNQIDVLDLQRWLSRDRADFNLDGNINTADLGILAGNFRKTGE